MQHTMSSKYSSEYCQSSRSSLFLTVALSIVVNLLSSDYRFYVPPSDLEKCQSLERQMSYGITSVLIKCGNITKLAD